MADRAPLSAEKGPTQTAGERESGARPVGDAHAAPLPGSTAETDRKTCGRCGVYRDLHPTTRCARSRPSFWWDRHSPVRHVAASVWVRLGDRRRMALCSWFWESHQWLCWCDFVDAALLDNKRDDYECGCDVPLPLGIREPDGRCYCPTPAQREEARRG